MEIQLATVAVLALAAAICWVSWKSHALYCTTRSHNDCLHKGECISSPISHLISVNTEAHKSCSTTTTHSSYPSFSANSHVHVLDRQRCDDFPSEMIRWGAGKKKSSGTYSLAGSVSKDWRHNKHWFLAVVSFAFCPSRSWFLAPTIGRFPVLGSCLSQQQIHLGLGDSHTVA